MVSKFGHADEDCSSKNCYFGWRERFKTTFPCKILFKGHFYEILAALEKSNSGYCGLVKDCGCGRFGNDAKAVYWLHVLLLLYLLLWWHVQQQLMPITQRRPHLT